MHTSAKCRPARSVIQCDVKSHTVSVDAVRPLVEGYSQATKINIAQAYLSVAREMDSAPSQISQSSVGRIREVYGEMNASTLLDIVEVLLGIAKENSHA